MITHNHLIYQADVNRHNLDENCEDELKEFLLNLVKEIQMKVLIEPQLKFSHDMAWTGFVGIVTSHIAFHYWIVEKYIQLDIYSCKPFDNQKAITFISNFWKATGVKALFIDRQIGRNFEIRRFQN